MIVFAGEPPKPADPPAPAWKADVDTASFAATQSADISWMLISSALVMFMMPGLALFYGGMVRRKNILGTMMHTMVALGLVGVQWVVIGYSLSFGDSKQGVIGYSPELVLLGTEAAIGTTKTVDDVLKEKKIEPEKATDEQKKNAEVDIKKLNRYQVFPATKCPLYLHAMFQGMFAIITVALISGAFAERVKFLPYCIFVLLWTTLVYDPIAHWVWSYNWDDGTAAGWLGKMGAIDFAGGTVVHIAAGVSGLVTVLILRKRNGYGKQVFHPNSIVLTLLGAGMLWFGWFGFNGGSAVASNKLAVNAFSVTQIAAATAALAWVIVEWFHRGKPTALGFASGVVAGLVAITPASGFVAPGGAMAIGAIAGFACYWAVAIKAKLQLDDSLDAFGIHGVGGIIGAVLTGVFCSVALWSYGSGSAPDAFPGAMELNGTVKTWSQAQQIKAQLTAVGASALYSALVTALLVVMIDKTIGFTLKPADESIGLDLSQHGEVGVDVGQIEDEAIIREPQSASKPRGNTDAGRFTVVIDGANPADIQSAWTQLCQPTEKAPKTEFVELYKYLTTVNGTRFKFRGGNPVEIKRLLAKLFEDTLDANVKTHVEH